MLYNTARPPTRLGYKPQSGGHESDLPVGSSPTEKLRNLLKNIRQQYSAALSHSIQRRKSNKTNDNDKKQTSWLTMQLTLKQSLNGSIFQGNEVNIKLNNNIKNIIVHKVFALYH